MFNKNIFIYIYFKVLTIKRWQKFNYYFDNYYFRIIYRSKHDDDNREYNS